MAIPDVRSIGRFCHPQWLCSNNEALLQARSLRGKRHHAFQTFSGCCIREQANIHPERNIIYAEGFFAEHSRRSLPYLSRNRPRLRRHGRIRGSESKSDDSRTSDLPRGRSPWGGQNQRDILVTLGYDIDKPWRDLPQKERQLDSVLPMSSQTVPRLPRGSRPQRLGQHSEEKEEPSYIGDVYRSEALRTSHLLRPPTAN